MNTSDIASTLRVRSVVFDILSRVFIDVPNEPADKLTEKTAGLLADIARSTENEDLKDGVALLFSFLQKNGNDISTCLDETRHERSLAFTSLFILGGQDSASVYESVHRTTEKLMQQEPWSEVKAFYYQNGFSCPGNNGFAEDHLSTELQFMGILSEKAAEACQKEEFGACEKFLNIQICFYEEHISQWIPNFCTKVAVNKDKANYAFYAAYSLILKGFITEDMFLLKELIEN